MLKTQSAVGALVLALCSAVGAEASQFGRNGFSGNPGTNAGATCTACHATGATLPALSISGPTSVAAGSTHEYIALLTGGPGVTGGLNVSSTDASGTLLPVDSDLQSIGGEVSHTAPKAFTAGQVEFRFEWTAPAFNGVYTLYGAGNSTDGQLDLLSDAIDTDSLAVTVSGGAPPPAPEPPPPPAEVVLELFASGFVDPVTLQHAGDDRLFVLEQHGRIRILQSDGSILEPPFLDIQARVDDAGSEQGLLGLAFHPDYASNGFFYVHYTFDPPGSGNDRSRVSRFTVSVEPDLADASSELVLLEFEQPFANHNGGDLRFGPDGYLYIASGDGGSGGDPFDNSQDRGTPLGKLLRIDVSAGGATGPDCDLSGGSNYSIPADNAFVGDPGSCDEIFIVGLRNPWRFSFDRDTGDLWVADVGQNAYEEISFIPSGTAAGLNLGWRCYEGNAAFNLSGCSSGYFFPVHDPPHFEGNCSVIGGFVYRGNNHPELDGRYFFTDYCNTAIRTVTRSGPDFIVEEVVPEGGLAQPVTFGENRTGELFVVSLAGEIYRLRGTQQQQVPTSTAWGHLVLLGLFGSLGWYRSSRRRRSVFPTRVS